jgi:hypothetical protein
MDKWQDHSNVVEAPVPADWSFGEMTNWVPLGQNHYGFLVFMDELPQAAIIAHRDSKYSWCAGVTWNSSVTAHFETLYPLTIRGSVYCADCGDEGTIIEGTWTQVRKPQ